MCNSSSSTEIAKESLKIISDNDFISDLRETTTSASALTSFDEKYFKKYAEDYTSNDDHKNRVREIFKYANLQRLKLLGGEPSIDPAIISVMKDLKEDRIKKSNGFRLQITTNMTNINKTWLDYFQVFNAKITASIDGAGRTYEYIRYPAKWNRIESNIKALTPETGSNDLSMNLVMSNILFLDIKHWIPILNNLALEKSFKLNFIECFYPTYMMPSNIRDFLDKSERYLESIANEDPDMNNLKAFFLINMKQDKLRKQNIFDINYTKEIYNKMNKGANNDRSKQI
jgi:sulfatase maturation enzyme AslB (radical SAM superfamily)